MRFNPPAPRAARGGQVLLSPINPDQQAGLFGGCQFLEAGDRAAGDDEGMAWRDGELVCDRGEEVVYCEHAGGFDFAEGRELPRRGEFRNCGFHASCLS